MMLDVLIHHGWVADGTGNPLYPADVAIEGDRIVDIGRLPGAQARREIDASGKIVCPGYFADVVVFDYQALEDGSTLEHPVAYARGVEYVLVNGAFTLDGGKHTGARAGRMLLHGA